MVWRAIGDKPLIEPMITRFAHAYMCHHKLCEYTNEMAVSYKTIKAPDVFHIHYVYLFDDIHKINSPSVLLWIIYL